MKQHFQLIFLTNILWRLKLLIYNNMHQQSKKSYTHIGNNVQLAATLYAHNTNKTYENDETTYVSIFYTPIVNLPGFKFHNTQ